MGMLKVSHNRQTAEQENKKEEDVRKGKIWEMKRTENKKKGKDENKIYSVCEDPNER